MDPIAAPSEIPIQGVRFFPLKVLTDERGALLHMLRLDPPTDDRYGEIYFSEINPGVVKAWKCHSRMTQRLAVPVGRVKFALYDDREGSPTRGAITTLILGRPDNYRLLVIPRGIWYGFKGVSDHASLIANCPDMPHDPSELQSASIASDVVPYRWE